MKVISEEVRTEAMGVDKRGSKEKKNQGRSLESIDFSVKEGAVGIRKRKDVKSGEFKRV